MLFTKLVPALTIFSLTGASLLSQGNLQVVITFTNQFRAQSGLRPICLSQKLNQSALKQSQYQAGVDKATHDGFEPLMNRLAGANFRASAQAESLLSTTSLNIATFLTLLLQSAESKANLMGDFTHMGIAAAKSSTGTIYWTQHFGKATDQMEQCDNGSQPSGSGTQSGSGAQAGSGTQTGSGTQSSGTASSSPSSASSGTGFVLNFRNICVKNACYEIQSLPTGAKFVETSWRPPSSYNIAIGATLF